MPTRSSTLSVGHNSPARSARRIIRPDRHEADDRPLPTVPTVPPFRLEACNLRKRAESVDIPVIFVGGPYDGQTGEEPADHREGDPPGRVYVFGFEEWPMDGGPPTGRYDPDTSEGKVPVPFIWRAYSPDPRPDLVSQGRQAVHR